MAGQSTMGQLFFFYSMTTCTVLVRKSLMIFLSKTNNDVF